MGPLPALLRSASGPPLAFSVGHSLKPCLPIAGLLAQGQYDLDPLPPFPDHVQYTHYSDQIGKGLAHPQVSPRPATPSRPGSLMCMAQPGPRWGRAMGIAWGGPWLSWDLLCPWGWGLASSPPIPHSSLLSDNPDYYDYQGKGLGAG